MRHLDLFSGIGGFALAAQEVWGPAHEIVSFCEIKSYCQKVLEKHWPGVPCHGDIKTLGGAQFGTIDLITGGFPCQDLSQAGKKQGTNGKKSGLYREMLRIISESRPQFALFENVRNLLRGEAGRWFAQFLYDLATIGYDAEWHCITASAAGANHHRDRVWIVAYPKGSTIKNSIFEGIPRNFFFKGKPRGNSWEPISGTYWEKAKPRITEVDDGLPGWVGSVSGYGNAIVPQVVMPIMQAIKETGAQNAKT